MQHQGVYINFFGQPFKRLFVARRNCGNKFFSLLRISLVRFQKKVFKGFLVRNHSIHAAQQGQQFFCACEHRRGKPGKGGSRQQRNALIHALGLAQRQCHAQFFQAFSQHANKVFLRGKQRLKRAQHRRKHRTPGNNFFKGLGNGLPSSSH